jgi:hypothetical protein
MTSKAVGKWWRSVNSSAVRLLVVVALWLGALPAFAQDAPDPAIADQGQDESAPALDATPTPTADAAAVIAQWGPAAAIGSDADQAVARRWFRDQNAMRGRWGVPTATRDPYLDWQAENLIRSSLGQAALPLPQGVVMPPIATQSQQSDQGVRSTTEFWTIGDDLWQAHLDNIAADSLAFWQADHPGDILYTRDNYLTLFKWGQTPRFDRYRIMGIAGRVNTRNAVPTALLSGQQADLEQIAPGSVDAYQPVIYSDNLVAMVGYDPWITPDGTLRP